MDLSAQRERILQALEKTYHTKPESLWMQYPRYCVFRHPESKKWYAVLVDVPRARLGLTGEGSVDLLNVRCGPLLTFSLQKEKGFLPAYHMHKQNWISILLDESVSDEQIVDLAALSFESVAPKP